MGWLSDNKRDLFVSMASLTLDQQVDQLASYPESVGHQADQLGKRKSLVSGSEQRLNERYICLMLLYPLLYRLGTPGSCTSPSGVHSMQGTPGPWLSSSLSRGCHHVYSVGNFMPRPNSPSVKIRYSSQNPALLFSEAPCLYRMGVLLDPCPLNEAIHTSLPPLTFRFACHADLSPHFHTYSLNVTEAEIILGNPESLSTLVAECSTADRYSKVTTPPLESIE